MQVCEFISDHVLVKCKIDMSCPVVCQKWISYRRYHRIDMTALRSDLQNVSFVESPANSATELYEQYVKDLTTILDRHAPLVSRLRTKASDKWMVEDFKLAKSLRQQIEHTCVR